MIARACFAGIVPERALVFANSARGNSAFSWLEPWTNYKIPFSVLIWHFKTELCYKTHIDLHNSVTSVRLFPVEPVTRRATHFPRLLASGNRSLFWSLKVLRGNRRTLVTSLQVNKCILFTHCANGWNCQDRVK